MGGIGEALKEAREKKGLDLRKAEEETKIRYKYLLALEQESFDELPGRTYTLGFLRSYARFLGMDAEDLAQRFKEAYKEEEPLPLEVTETRPGRRGGLGWLVLLLALLALAFWWYRNGGGSARTSQAPQVVGQVREPLPPPPPEPAPETLPPVPRGVEVSLSVEGSASWMAVRADGKEIFSGTLRPGQGKFFQAKENLYLHLGNAGAVRVRWNGQDLGLMGEPGQVVKREFTPTGSQEAP